MRLDLHAHIPKLEQFALYAACDRVVLHGKAGLKKPIPYLLYLRCILAFNERHRSKPISLTNMLRRWRRGDRFGGHDAGFIDCVHLTVQAAACVLDHAVISPGNLGIEFIFSTMMRNASDDVDCAVQCIHRFAARCETAGAHELLMKCVNEGLRCEHNRDVALVLIQYGARTDSDIPSYAVRYAVWCGTYETVSTLISNNSSHHDRNSELIDAIDRGDKDIITLVFNAIEPREWKEMQFHLNDISVGDFTVPLCEFLLSLGVLRQGKRYRLFRIRSVAVVQWFIDHDLTSIDRTFKNVVDSAIGSGGVYHDVLQYLVEQVHVPVPYNILMI